MTRASLTLPTLCLLAALSAAAPTRAQPALVATAHFTAANEAEVAIVGANTLVAEERKRKLEHETTAEVLDSIAPGHRPGLLAVVGVGAYASGTLSFAASPRRIVVLDDGNEGGYKGTSGSPTERFESGPLGGALSRLDAGCALVPGLDLGAFERFASEDPPRNHENVAADEDEIAYDSFGCVIVDDFASGTERVIPLEATLNPIARESGPPASARYYVVADGWETKLRLAGGLLAYRANTPSGAGASVVVYDVDTSQPLYRVPLPADYAPAPFSDPVGPTFDVQADGSLMIADARSCTATVSTPAQPAPRPFGLRVCAVRRLLDGRALVVVPDGRRRRELAWTPLHDPKLHPVAALGTDGVLEATQATMDERYVAYALGSCWGAHVFRAPLADPGTPPSPPDRCPANAPSGHASVSGHELTVRISCPRGCEGFGRAEIRSPSARNEPRDLRGEASTTLSIAPGHTSTWTVLRNSGELGFGEGAGRTLARELREGATLYLEVELQTRTPAADRCEGCEGRIVGTTFDTRTKFMLPIELAGPR
jgi:hypothetical protein